MIPDVTMRKYKPPVNSSHVSYQCSDCEHVIEPEELFMGYKTFDFYEVVCLTCHFWNVDNKCS